MWRSAFSTDVLFPLCDRMVLGDETPQQAEYLSPAAKRNRTVQEMQAESHSLNRNTPLQTDNSACWIDVDNKRVGTSAPWLVRKAEHYYATGMITLLYTRVFGTVGNIEYECCVYLVRYVDEYGDCLVLVDA